MRLRDVWARVVKEAKYQWKPFEGTVGCRDFAEADEQTPGYWRKGKFLKDWHFWVGNASLFFFAWLISPKS
jgi:hypothetical protein